MPCPRFLFPPQLLCAVVAASALCLPLTLGCEQATATQSESASTSKAASSSSESELPRQDPGKLTAEVKTFLQTQAKDWTAGKLKAFCAVYADDAVFISPSGKTVGRQAIYDRYEKKYKTGGAEMGELELLVEDIRLSPDQNAAMVVMVWKLAFSDGHDPNEASGLSLVTMLRHVSSDGPSWRIVQDASM